MSYDETQQNTAAALIAAGKGLLAMDESNPTCNKRFEKLGIATTEDNRRAYREIIATAPNLGDYISGAILYDETARQTTSMGRPFIGALAEAGIIPGIKVDRGTVPLTGHPGEAVTEGLDGLGARVAEYRHMGVRFAKWRAVIAIGERLPSETCIQVNAQVLARYAAICQEGGLVPIVEPEVLMDGTHSLDRCYEVTEWALRAVFHCLYQQGVVLERMLLKPNMVLPGKDSPESVNEDAIAAATVGCLRRAVPAAVPGIAFLSGGQTSEQAVSRLNAMHRGHAGKLPWALSFSFSRALQQPALDAWRGDPENAAEAQRLLLQWARNAAAARDGRYGG